MERRTLGRTGLKVSVLGLGAGQFGAFGQVPEADSIRLVHCALDGGINLVDTADFYSAGESETYVGAAIKDRRDKVILATKCGMPMSEDSNERGGSRRWIMASIEGSLRRLQTDYIDLYQLHAPDFETDLEETLGAMTDLVRAGKVRYFGTSNTSGMRIAEAALKAKLGGFIAPHSEQQSYSIFTRGPEAEVLPACLAHGAGALAYSPLDGGWLAGRYRKDRTAEVSPRQRLQPTKYDTTIDANQRKLDKVEALAQIAEDAGIDMAHMGVGFVLAHPAVATALIGGGKTSYIEHHLKGPATLSDETLDRIDAVMAPGENFTAAPAATPALTDKTQRRRRAPMVEAPTASVDFIRRMVGSEKAS
jgi:aryl-alcohol dehydrogenase-like predicted oxidoreductase